ncbi:MAG: biotin--[acetyl-CoA-carboxylase] ligase [Nitrosomonas sp.]|nr:biotin--[acetyl-CoA-carboxylase] ligase [Nitrosomonas sp.]
MNPFFFSILRILSDGKFYSIYELARSLNKDILYIKNTLLDIQRYGIILQQTYEHAYRWVNPIIWMNKDEINNYLHEDKQFYQFVVLDSVDSTNRFLLDCVGKDFAKFPVNTVIVTELQTMGRGRQGRQWFSGFGDSLTFSLLWRFERSINQISGLSLVVGIGIVRALKKFNISDVCLKWPNDVLICFRKLAGILIEVSNNIRNETFVVIGIGMNVQLSTKTKEYIDQAFTDLFSITGQPINRNLLLAVLLTELTSVLNEFNYSGFTFFRNEWLSYHAYDGQLISLLFPDGSIKEGISVGVDFDGSLRLKLATGEIRSFNTGELMLS